MIGSFVLLLIVCSVLRIVGPSVGVIIWQRPVIDHIGGPEDAEWRWLDHMCGRGVEGGRVMNGSLCVSGAMKKRATLCRLGCRWRGGLYTLSCKAV